MKHGLVALIAYTVSSLGFGAQALTGDYRLHLYFGDSTPFEDDLRIERDAKGVASGTMHVPNDFDGKIENIVETEAGMTFDLLVPKNPKRPEMVFRYVTHALLPEAENLAGFVTLVKSDGVAVEGNPYIGSFVAFRKK